MGDVAIRMKVMPESTDVDLAKLKEQLQNRALEQANEALETTRTWQAGKAVLTP